MYYKHDKVVPHTHDYDDTCTFTLNFITFVCNVHAGGGEIIVNYNLIIPFITGNGGMI